MWGGWGDGLVELALLAMAAAIAVPVAIVLAIASLFIAIPAWVVVCGSLTVGVVAFVVLKLKVR